MGSNISENLDFTISYTANYTIVKNTLQNNQTITTLIKPHRLDSPGFSERGLFFSSNLNNTPYRGLSAAYDRSIWFWNAGLGYKFLKDQKLEVKLNAFDILNQKPILKTAARTYLPVTSC